jgi:hypothetical protein
VKANVQTRKPTYRIGSSKRMAEKKFNGVPAPGKYDLVSDNTFKKQLPQWRFGSGQRTNLSGSDLKVPGPGAYEYRSSVGDLPC